MQGKYSARHSPGDIVRVVQAPDQGGYIRNLAGSTGILIKNLDETDGVTSSKNIWSVLVSGKIIHLHILDFTSIQ